MRIEQEPLEDLDRGWLVRPQGPIRARATDAFRARVDALLDSAATSLLLDLDGVDSIDSSTAGYLLMVHDRLKASGGNLALARLQPGVHVVIDSIGLTSFFRVCDSVEEATRHLREATD